LAVRGAPPSLDVVGSGALPDPVAGTRRNGAPAASPSGGTARRSAEPEALLVLAMADPRLLAMLARRRVVADAARNGTERPG
jgi:hypothetical protein